MENKKKKEKKNENGRQYISTAKLYVGGIEMQARLPALVACKSRYARSFYRSPRRRHCPAGIKANAKRH